MLSLTVFAAAASAATQTAPATVTAPAVRPMAGQAGRAAKPISMGKQHYPTVWRFTEPGVDGGQIWL